MGEGIIKVVLVSLRNDKVLPARRYASVGVSYGPVSVCLSVRLTGGVQIVELVFESSFELFFKILEK